MRTLTGTYALTPQVYKALHAGILPVAVKILTLDPKSNREPRQLEFDKHLYCPNIVQFLCALGPHLDNPLKPSPLCH